MSIDDGGTCISDKDIEGSNATFDAKDFDECAKNNGGCHKHASCTNEFGGFSCDCVEGFSGDGFNCQPDHTKGASREIEPSMSLSEMQVPPSSIDMERSDRSSYDMERPDESSNFRRPRKSRDMHKRDSSSLDMERPYSKREGDMLTSFIERPDSSAIVSPESVHVDVHMSSSKIFYYIYLSI
jgi:hypothetical protein